jgi:hypothetical protein
MKLHAGRPSYGFHLNDLWPVLAVRRRGSGLVSLVHCAPDDISVIRIKRFVNHPISKPSMLEAVSIGRQPDLADSCQIHMLFGAPKIILILHGEPAFRGSSQRL